MRPPPAPKIFARSAFCFHRAWIIDGCECIEQSHCDSRQPSDHPDIRASAGDVGGPQGVGPKTGRPGEEVRFPISNGFQCHPAIDAATGGKA